MLWPKTIAACLAALGAAAAKQGAGEGGLVGGRLRRGTFAWNTMRVFTSCPQLL